MTDTHHRITLSDPRRFVVALQKLRTVVLKKTSLPILSYVSLFSVPGMLRLHGTDLTCSVLVDVVCNGEEGTLPPLCVELEPLYRAVKDVEVTDSITLDARPTHLRVVTSTGYADVKLLPFEDFPLVPVSKEPDISVSVRGSALRDGLNQTAYATILDPTHPVFATVCCDVLPEALGLCGTDGHRLAYARVPVSDSKGVGSVLIRDPKRLATLLPDGIVSLQFSVDDHGYRLTATGPDDAGCMRVVQGGMSGTFPEYQRIVPTDGITNFPTCIVMSRKELLKALRTVKFPGYRGATQSVRIVALGKNEVAFRSYFPELEATREARLPAHVIHAGEFAAFNRLYVEELVKTVPGESIVCGVQQPGQPSKWGSLRDNVAAPNYGVIMPMWIPDKNHNYPEGYPDEWKALGYRDDVQLASENEENV